MRTDAEIKEDAKEMLKLGIVVPRRYPPQHLVDLVTAYTDAVRESTYGSDIDDAVERCRYRDLMERCRYRDLMEGLADAVAPAERSQAMTRTPEQIEAGARAIGGAHRRWQQHDRPQGPYLDELAKACLDAADAVAAPAVGVTADRDILIERFFYAFREHVDYEMCMEWLADDDGYGPRPSPKTDEAFGRVLDALLTAQPADDAGEA